MSFSKNAIPQLVIQEVDIPEGDNNYIEQVINQDMIVHVLEIPDLENITGIQSFIQTDSDIGTDNQVSQNIHQTTVDFPLFPSNYSPLNSVSIVSKNLSLNFDEFINNDDVLDTVQFINQQAFVEGNSNSLDFYSEQRIYDLSGYGEFGFDPDYVFDESIAFDNFLENFASSSLLDSTQLGVQVVRVFGDDNKIIQEIDQSIDTFIILEEDYSQELSEESDHLYPLQFAFQESFLDNDNNIIEQNINQNIQLNFGFSDIISDELIGTKGGELANPEFSIDDFILPILDNNNESSELFQNHEVLADQKNQQMANVFGNDNEDAKNNNQILIASEGETRELVLENPDNTFEAGLTDYFDGQEDFIFNDSDNNSIFDLGLAALLNNWWIC
jgi:hypothetical protein